MSVFAIVSEQDTTYLYFNKTRKYRHLCKDFEDKNRFMKISLNFRGGPVFWLKLEKYFELDSCKSSVSSAVKNKQQ